MADHDGLHKLAARQYGVVSRRQLAEHGYTPPAVAHAVERGRLEWLSGRVLRIGGSPDTSAQRAMAATLDVQGGAVALHSAAALWRLPGFTLEPVHVLTTRRPHRGTERVGLVHSSVRFAEADVCQLDGIAVTTPLRTLRDLASRIHPARLGDVCDRMLTQRLIRLEALHALAADLPARGGSVGTRAVRRLAITRPVGHRPPDSGLERRFESILREAGEEPFDRQVDVGDELGWIGRVDFVDRELRVIVEVQSDLFHTGPGDRERDAERVRKLRRAGWTVVEVTEHEVWHRRHVVLAKVRAARCAARVPARGGR